MSSLYGTCNFRKSVAIIVGIAISFLGPFKCHADEYENSVKEATKKFSAFMEQGRDAEAAAAGERLIELRKKDKTTPDGELGLLAGTVARAFHGAGYENKAHEYFNEAEIALKRAMEKEKTDVPGEGYKVLGWFYYGVVKNNGDALRHLGRLDEARSKYQKVISELSPHYGDDDENVTNAYSGLADLAADEGRLDEASSGYSRLCKKIENRHKAEDPTLSNCLNNLARVYHLAGRYPEAEEASEKALALRDPTGTSFDSQIAIYLVTLAELKGIRARYQEAEALLRRAISIFERNAGPNYSGIALALNNLVVQLLRQERYAEAETLARRAMQVSERSEEKDSSATLIISAQLAFILSVSDRLTESADLYRHIIEKGERDAGFRKSLYMAWTYNNLGFINERTGDYEAAERLYKKALDLAVERLGLYHRDTAIGLNNLARAAQLQGKAQEAEELYLRSLSIKEKTFDDKHPSVAVTYSNLGDLYRSQRLWEKAFPLFEKAAAIYSKHDRTNTLLDGRPENQTGGERAAFEGYAQAAWHLAQRHPEKKTELEEAAFTAIQLAINYSAARAVAQMSARFANSTKAVAAFVRERQDIAGELADLDQRVLSAFSVSKAERLPEQEKALRERTIYLKAKLTEVDRRLEDSFPEYVELTRPKPISLVEAQMLLTDEQALLLFLALPAETIAFSVTKREVRWMSLPIGAEPLEDRISALRCGLDPQEWEGIEAPARCQRLLGTGKPAEEEPLPFHIGIAHALYEDLLAPFEDALKDKQLLIVPTGALTSLPFQVLVTKKPSGDMPKSYEGYRGISWLIRGRPLSVLPSVTSLKSLKRDAGKSRAPNAYAAWGNPKLKGDPTCPIPDEPPSSCSATWAKTANTRENRTRRPPTRSGSAASIFARNENQNTLQKAILGLCPLPDTAFEIQCLSQGLSAEPGARRIRLGEAATSADVKDLSEKGELANYRVVHFATHGLLSGDVENLAKRHGEPALVLTPTELDSGLLEASEIAQLQFDADWAILSACNTAAGANKNSEAMSGLARAFIYGGTRSLLVSHWPVYSDAATRLIVGIFAAINEGGSVSKADALRLSMIALMDDTKSQGDNSHPSVWAPFVLIGEGGR